MASKNHVASPIKAIVTADGKKVVWMDWIWNDCALYRRGLVAHQRMGILKLMSPPIIL